MHRADDSIGEPSRRAGPAPPRPAPRWSAAIERHCRRIDIVPDLAEDIGSRRWFRGLGTMLALGGAALAFWPDFAALEAATPSARDRDIRDEFRSQMILPLAQGGDSGRRMGATAAVAPLASVPERPRLRMTATLAQGDSFARMLQRAGVGEDDAGRVAAMIGAETPPATLAPGTRFDIVLGRRTAQGGPRALERLSFRARFDLDVSIDRAGGALAIARRPIAVDSMPLRIQGVAGPSLYRAARAAGAPIRAIQQYLQALGGRISLDSDIAPTDRFDIIVAHKRSASGEAESGELLYAGLERAGRPVAQLMRWGEGGQFFDAAGIGGQSATMGLGAPVAGRMTSGYGMRRHPILGYSRMHAGIDFGAAWGSPVYAVSDGAVSFAGRHGGHGNYVRIDHGGGLGTGYAHMSRIAVTPGAHVRAGQVIGYVGSTGLSTGPHLHYELYQNGRAVNPLGVRFAVRAGLDDKEQAAFKARMAELKKVTPGAALQKLRPRLALNGD